MMGVTLLGEGATGDPVSRQRVLVSQVTSARRLGGLAA
jgi:hypothetical protein